MLRKLKLNINREKNKISSLDNVELIRPNTDINISMLYQKCASNDP